MRHVTAEEYKEWYVGRTFKLRNDKESETRRFEILPSTSGTQNCTLRKLRADGTKGEQYTSYTTHSVHNYIRKGDWILDPIVNKGITLINITP